MSRELLEQVATKDEQSADEKAKQQSLAERLQTIDADPAMQKETVAEILKSEFADPPAGSEFQGDRPLSQEHLEATAAAMGIDLDEDPALREGLEAYAKELEKKYGTEAAFGPQGGSDSASSGSRGFGSESDFGESTPGGDQSAADLVRSNAADPNEYARKKKAWEEEQRYRDEMARDRVREQRDMAQNRRSSGPSGRTEKPALGVRNTKASNEDQAALKRRMRQWHQGYTRTFSPVKGAIATVLKAERAGDGSAILASCRDLSATLGRVLSQDDLYSSPNPRVNDALENSYARFHRMANACAQGRAGDADQFRREAERYLTIAARALGPYGLKP